MDFSDEGVEHRINQDLVARSLPGLVVISVAWPVISVFSGVTQANNWLSFKFIVALWLVSLLRIVFQYNKRWLEERKIRHWRIWFAAGALFHGAIWSSLFVLCIIHPTFNKLLNPMVMATAGLSVGAVSSFAPSYNLLRIHAPIVLLPAAITAFFIPEHQILSILLFIFFAYILTIGKKTHQEYLNYFQIEKKLNAKQFELEIINKTDQLTQVLNRSEFDKSIKSEWKRAIRIPTELAVLFIDIDNFKDVNDNYGHQAGDECLRQVASIFVRIAKRETDLVCRYGGEEFAIILPATSTENATILAERIRHEAGAKEISLGEVEISVTVSVGVSGTIPMKNACYETLIEEADKALYHAKTAGRNRVCIYSQE